MIKKNSCCSCGPSCCGDNSERSNSKRCITIDFLYLDVTVCERCQGTDESLDDAIKEVSKVLESTGIEVIVNKINVVNEELAEKYKFETSPTIRINGNDIQMDFKESLCESCGDLCGDEVDCRVWLYQGKEYTEPPKAMIIEAILKEVYGGSSEIGNKSVYKIPENLRKYYTSKQIKDKI